MAGMLPRAKSPSAAGFVGTGRQVWSSRPDSAKASATRSRAPWSHSKRTATPRRPRRAWGTWIRRPAPSPLLPSASIPPRWASRASASTPSLTTSCEGSCAGVAMKPMPQAARCDGRSPAQPARVREDIRLERGTRLRYRRPGIETSRSGLKHRRQHWHLFTTPGSNHWEPAHHQSRPTLGVRWERIRDGRAAATAPVKRPRKPRAVICRQIGTPRASAAVICRQIRTREPLEAEQAVHPQRDRHVQPGLRVVEVHPRDLPDPVQPVAQRVRVDLEPARGPLLLALLQVRLQRVQQ